MKNEFLPTSLEIGGKLYPIRSDFRVVLFRIYSALDDDELSNEQKAYVCMKCLYKNYDMIPKELLQEACTKAYWFVGGGDVPQTKPEKAKMIDWKKDQNIIFPAIGKVIGCAEVRLIDYMHWWTFLGLFGEIGEGLFSTVIGLRQKIANGKKLEKWEKEFLSKHRALVDLSFDESRERDEFNQTQKVLDELT